MGVQVFNQSKVVHVEYDLYARVGACNTPGMARVNKIVPGSGDRKLKTYVCPVPHGPTPPQQATRPPKCPICGHLMEDKK